MINQQNKNEISAKGTKESTKSYGTGGGLYRNANVSVKILNYFIIIGILLLAAVIILMAKVMAY